MFQFDPPSDELLNELREKHGKDMREVEDEAGCFVLVKPERPRPHLQRWTETASNERKRLEACEAIVKSCCAYPDKDTLRKVFEDQPGLIMTLTEPALELFGLRQAAVKKG